MLPPRLCGRGARRVRAWLPPGPGATALRIGVARAALCTPGALVGLLGAGWARMGRVVKAAARTPGPVLRGKGAGSTVTLLLDWGAATGTTILPGGLGPEPPGRIPEVTVGILIWATVGPRLAVVGLVARSTGPAWGPGPCCCWPPSFPLILSNSHFCCICLT